jgi:hypothetical protein
MRASGKQLPADHEGRVITRLGQHAGDKAGRGGLAVGTGHRDAAPEAHQLAQHLGARHHRDAAFLCSDQLGVVGLDGT